MSSLGALLWRQTKANNYDDSFLAFWPLPFDLSSHSNCSLVFPNFYANQMHKNHLSVWVSLCYLGLWVNHCSTVIRHISLFHLCPQFDAAIKHQSNICGTLLLKTNWLYILYIIRKLLRGRSFCSFKWMEHVTVWHALVQYVFDKAAMQLPNPPWSIGCSTTHWDATSNSILYFNQTQRLGILGRQGNNQNHHVEGLATLPQH